MRKLFILIMLMGMLTLVSSAFGSTGAEAYAKSDTSKAYAGKATASAKFLQPVPVFSILMIAVFVVSIWIIPALVCAEAARRKGLSHFWFCGFSIFFTPLLGFLAVIAMTPKKKTLIEDEQILDEETYGEKDEAFHIGDMTEEE